MANIVFCFKDLKEDIKSGRWYGVRASWHNPHQFLFYQDGRFYMHYNDRHIEPWNDVAHEADEYDWFLTWVDGNGKTWK